MESKKEVNLTDLDNLVYYKNKKGIYKITNTINQKRYIGQSIDLYKRLREHINGQKYKQDRNKVLYRAFRKYGIDKFKVSMVEEVKDLDGEELIKRLNKLEIFYIDKYETFGKEYNSTTGGDFNPSYSKEVVERRRYTLLNNKEVNEKLRLKGEDNPRARLNEDDVNKIRKRYSEGENRRVIYEDYDDKVSFSAFQCAMYGKSWRHLEIPKKPIKKGLKLTSKSASDMRKMYMKGETIRFLSKEYGVSIEQARRVVKVQRWANEEAIPKGYEEYINLKNGWEVKK